MINEKRKERLLQMKREQMLQDIKAFIEKFSRVPRVSDFKNPEYFTYSYSAYNRIFGGKNLAIATILPEVQHIIKSLPKRVCSPYKPNLNLMSGKIHNLLTQNPNAGYNELKEMFGTVTRSIRVTYYNTYKEMFQKPGSLRYKKRDLGIKTKAVIQYFQQYPDRTIADAARDLNYKYSSILHGIYKARCRGISINFVISRQSKYNPDSITAKVRSYYVEHPKASSAECATFLGTSREYVSAIRSRAKRKINKEES